MGTLAELRSRLSVVVSDITTLEAEVIVNAASSRLIPGGGVDGAINKAAGPELARAMMAIGKCDAGEAVVTPGFKLRARLVIHTVAPMYSQHTQADVWRLLANCYANCLSVANREQTGRIAFPSLGTGVYGIPIERASEVALTAAIEHCSKHAFPQHVIFCCFSRQDGAIYQERLESLLG